MFIHTHPKFSFLFFCLRELRNCPAPTPALHRDWQSTCPWGTYCGWRCGIFTFPDRGRSRLNLNSHNKRFPLCMVVKFARFVQNLVKIVSLQRFWSADHRYCILSSSLWQAPRQNKNPWGVSFCLIWRRYFTGLDLHLTTGRWIFLLLLQITVEGPFDRNVQQIYPC